MRQVTVARSFPVSTLFFQKIKDSRLSPETRVWRLTRYHSASCWTAGSLWSTAWKLILQSL